MTICGPPRSNIRNKLACIGTVKLLTLEDYDRLFPLIRRVNAEQTRQLVDDYLVRIKKPPRHRRKRQLIKWQTDGEYI